MHRYSLRRLLSLVAMVALLAQIVLPRQYPSIADACCSSSTVQNDRMGAGSTNSATFCISAELSSGRVCNNHMSTISGSSYSRVKQQQYYASRGYSHSRGTATPINKLNATNTPIPPTATGTPTSTNTPLPVNTATSTATPTSSSTNPPSATSTVVICPCDLGYINVGSQMDSGDANNINGSRFTTSSGGAISSMSVYVGEVGAAPNNQYQLAIYTDSNGVPGSLLASSATGTLTANAWNTLPISTTLSPHTAYWLVYNTNGASTLNNMQYDSPIGGASEAYSTNAISFGSWPTTFAATVSNDWAFSIYATYSSSGIGATSTPTSISPTATATTTGHLVFDEEFTGSSLNTTTWSALNRPGDASNSEQQCYLPGNAGIVNGALVLTDKQDTSCGGYGYTSAMVQTKSYNFTYGTLEVRAQMPSGTGQWPALWLLGMNCQATNPNSASNSGACQWPTPGSNEIDLFEGKSTQTSTGFFNLSTGTSPNNDNQAFGCNNVSLPFDTSTGYHRYDLIWQPNSLVWQIDGHTYCSTSANVPSTAMFIIMNIALGGTFTGGSIDASVLPQTMHVDYVRVYQ